jgi:DNA (cytosine-5)-methyltransferase 1
LNGLALFAGYGGLEIGIDAAFGGVRTVGYVERESYAAATLVARMEEQTLDQAPIWDDVTTFDGQPWRGVVDIISAGFPCQPFSSAGQRKGTADERWLWDDIERIIREVQPRWFIGENVPGLVRLGLEAVLRSLATLGYDVSWGAFRAEQVGAAHKRERIFILAKRRHGVGWGNGARKDALPETGASEKGWHAVGKSGGSVGDTLLPQRTAYEHEVRTGGDASDDAGGDLADTDSARPQGRSGSGQGQEGRQDEGRQAGDCGRPLFAIGPDDLNMWARVLSESPTLEPSICRMADGAAERLDHSKDRLRACGNGVVPLQAAVAIRALADRAGWQLN